MCRRRGAPLTVLCRPRERHDDVLLCGALHDQHVAAERGGDESTTSTVDGAYWRSPLSRSRGLTTPNGGPTTTTSSTRRPKPTVQHPEDEGDGHLPGSSRNVQLIGQSNIAGADGGRVADVAAFGNYAYLTVRDPVNCTGDGAAGVAVFDISNPSVRSRSRSSTRRRGHSPVRANAHQAEFSLNGKFIIGTDEDFLAVPRRLRDRVRPERRRVPGRRVRLDRSARRALPGRAYGRHRLRWARLCSQPRRGPLRGGDRR